MQSFTLTIGLFNHARQYPLSVGVESCNLSEWLESQHDEMTLECVEIDTQAFETIKCFDQLVVLINWLESQDYIDLDQVSDFLSLFSLADLHLYDDYHTGCSDFSEYAQSLADECLLHSVSDDIKCYFDYDRFERDLAYDYSIGRYVWRAC